MAVFAGIWVDPFRSELHVAVTSDVDEVVEELTPLIPRGQTLFVHRFQHPMSELESIMDRLLADHEELRAEGLYLSSFGTDEKNNCVLVTIDPLNDQVVTDLRRRYGAAIAFEYSARPAPIPSVWPTAPEVVEAIAVSAGGPELLTCDGHPFPASVLESPEVDDVPPDLADDVHAAANFWEQEFGDLDGMHWRLSYRDDVSAEFVAKAQQGWIHLGLEKDAQGWRPAGIGQCQPRGIGIDSAGEAEWTFDPDYDPHGPDATELHVIITERACSGGIPAYGRIVPPEVVYLADSLILRVGVRPVGGMATCPGNPPTPATVLLPRPLGDRVVLDGSKHPPAPPDSAQP